MRFITLHTTEGEEFFLNVQKIVRIQSMEKEVPGKYHATELIDVTQIDFDHPDLYAVVVETPEEVLAEIKRSTEQ